MTVFKNVHIRRTSREQLTDVLKSQSAEMWGYRRNSGEVVAAVMIRDIDEDSGTVDMLSVMPEYMGLGLSSALLRNSEFVLHEAGKTMMKMKVYMPKSYNANDFTKLGYTIMEVGPWIEMKDQLQESVYNNWVVLTLGKYI